MGVFCLASTRIIYCRLSPDACLLSDVAGLITHRRQPAAQSTQFRLRSTCLYWMCLRLCYNDRLRPFSRHRPSSNCRSSSRCRIFNNHRAAGALARKHLRIRGPATTDSFAHPAVSKSKGQIGVCSCTGFRVSGHSVCIFNKL